MDINKTFPEGTSNNSGMKTTALPKIWEKKELFIDKMQESINKAKDLVLAAEENDKKIIAKALGALGKSCGNCHNEFREKKN